MSYDPADDRAIGRAGEVVTLYLMHDAGDPTALDRATAVINEAVAVGEAGYLCAMLGAEMAGTWIAWSRSEGVDAIEAWRFRQVGMAERRAGGN
jgi:hypothetical protein